MRKLLIGVGLVLVLVVGGVWLFVNELLGTAIERGARYALGVDVRVGFVRLALLSADFRMNGFQVANPPGFDEPRFLRLARAQIDVDPGTLRQDVVVVRHFGLEDVDVALEREGQRTNYGAILDHLKRFESKKSDTPVSEQSGGGKRLIVEHLAIRDVLAHVEWTGVASDQSAVEVVIPEILLEGIGAKDGRGVSMAELTNIVTKAILGSIARYGGDLPGVMLGELRSGLGGLSRVPGVVVKGIGGSAVEKAGDVIGGPIGDAVRGVGGSAVEGVGEAAADQAGKALGKLFGGSSEGGDPK